MKTIIPACLAVLATLVLAPRAAEACACCGSYQVVNVAYNDVLNLRSGPSSRYRIIGSIPPGSGCVVINGPCSGNWCRVSYGGQSGWAHTGYLRYISGHVQ